MAQFQFLTLGVGSAFSALHYSSCLALRADETWLLIDCPHPIRKILRESSVAAGLSLDIKDMSAVVLTHLHGDHASGLELYGYFRHYVLQGGNTQVYAHPEASARLWDGLLAASMESSLGRPGEPVVRHRFEDYFDLHDLSESGSIQTGPFSIECRRTIHSLPTTALRIRAAGRTLGYSADTAFDPQLIDWLAPADTIIHETGEAGLHTPYKDLAALPNEIRSKMRLIHYSDVFDKVHSLIEPLDQGRLYDV